MGKTGTNKQTNQPTNHLFHIVQSIVIIINTISLSLSHIHIFQIKKKKKILNPKSLSSDGREMGADGDGADSDEHSGDQVLGQEGRNPHPSCQ